MVHLFPREMFIRRYLFSNSEINVAFTYNFFQDIQSQRTHKYITVDIFVYNINNTRSSYCRYNNFLAIAFFLNRTIFLNFLFGII